MNTEERFNKTAKEVRKIIDADKLADKKLKKEEPIIELYLLKKIDRKQDSMFVQIANMTAEQKFQRIDIEELKNKTKTYDRIVWTGTGAFGVMTTALILIAKVAKIFGG